MTDYTKLIERLRSGYQGIQLGAVGMGWDFDAKTIIEAAKAIEALAAENERLKSEREALRDSAKEVVRLRDALQAKLNAMGKGEPVAPEQVEAAWRAGWAACRDAEYVGQEAEDEAWGMSQTCANADWESAAPKALAPLTQTEVVEAFCNTRHNTQYVSVFDAGVRFAEKHHGIGGTP